MNPSLRTRLILSFSVGITLSVVLILMAMHRFIDSHIAGEIAAESEMQEKVLRSLHDTETVRQILRFERLASEPRLRALASQNDAATLAREADQLAQDQNCRHVTLLAPDGSLRATSDASSPSAIHYLDALRQRSMATNRTERFALQVDGEVLDTVTVPIHVDHDLSAILALSSPVSSQALASLTHAMNLSRLQLLPTRDTHEGNPDIGDDLVRDVAFADGFHYRIVLDPQRIERPFKSIFISIALIGLFSILTTVIVTLVLASHITKPIDALASVAAVVSEGDLRMRCPLTGPREVRQLAECFNRMLDTIVNAQEELQRQTSELRIQMDEREALQAQLIQVQKMEAIGRVAGGVSHDFNNLLTVIIGHCQLAMADMPRDNRSYNDLEQVLNAGERAAELTRQLLVFSRKQTLQSQVLQINDVIRGMVPMLKRILGANIVIETRLADELYMVRADPSRIEQVIMNLVVNACEAMKSNGTLTIETTNFDLSETSEAKFYGAGIGAYASMRVIDTGCGMDDETRARIFEPFFTTKDKARGTGMGLSTVYGILQRMGAVIRVESEPGRGSTFQILFKCAAYENEESAIVDGKDIALKGSETVLVVDDEAYLVEILSKTLSEKGYTVIQASNAEEAVFRAEQHEHKIELLIADIALPGMNGPELSAVLTRKMPSLRTLYVTGYTNDSDMNRRYSEAFATALRKPFSMDELLCRVRECLDEVCMLPHRPKDTSSLDGRS